MKKISTMFQRDWDGDRSRVLDIPMPNAQWVFDGEGVATQKLDGTACLISGGVLYARYDVRKGKEVPEGFIPAQEPDVATGHWPGWVPVGQRSDNRWKYHIEAWDIAFGRFEDGTYELCGPKIQKNPEHLSEHHLVAHGTQLNRNIDFSTVPRSYEAILEWFRGKDIEGVVWHHPDGRMVKIKKSDFGLKRLD